jgi:bifunctional UDP-N-acetylglucosamine pyrophosphorylase/glucosamine-1-phosphate N-acetyltransferase
VIAIVEEAVATPEQLKICEYNISVYCFEASWLWENLRNIKTSAKGEYYLTDLIAMAVEQEKKLDAYILQDPVEGLGINNRVDLADCELAMRKRVIRQWMLDGVTFLDPGSCTIESDVVNRAGYCHFAQHPPTGQHPYRRELPDRTRHNSH